MKIVVVNLTMVFLCSYQKTFQNAGSIWNFDGFLINYFILYILSCLIFGTSFAKLYGG